jgi:hypothetical protein
MPLDKNPGRCGYGYAAGKKTETEINLAASFHEWRQILFRFGNPGSQMCMGCMGN